MILEATEGPGPGGGRGNRLRKLYFYGACAYLVLWAAWVWTGWLGPFASRVFIDLSLTLLPLGAGFLFLLQTGDEARIRRLPWISLGLACLAWAAGSAVWIWYEPIWRTEPPFPSLADAGYLSFLPLFGAGLLTLLSGPSLMTRWRVLLDGLIVGACLFSIIGTLWLRPIFTYALQSGRMDAQALLLLYPVGDIVLLTVAAHILFNGPSAVRPLIGTLIAALLVMTFVDVGFWHLVAEDKYQTGSFIDIGWAAAFLLIGYAALVPAGSGNPARSPESDMRRAVGPMFFFLPTVLVLVAVQIDEGQLSPFVFWSGLGTTLLVLVRQMILGVENTRLQLAMDAARLQISASEMKFRRLFEAAKDGILILDFDSGAITDANAFICNLLGHARAELVGLRLWDIGPLKDVIASRQAFAELKSQGSIRYEDLPLRAPDGRRVDVEFISNVYQVSGKPVIQCNIRDISARVRSEGARRESDRRLTAMMEHARFLALMLDRQGRVTYCNDALVKLIGAPREQIMGQNWIERFLPPEIGLEVEAVHAALIDGDHKAASYYENELITASGKRRLIRWSNSVLFDGGGEAIGSASLGEDTTEVQQAQRALEASEARFRALIENVSDVVTIVREDGSLAYISSAVFTIAGHDPEDMLGRNMLNYTHPDDRRAAMTDLAKLLREPELVLRGTRRYRTAAGDWLWAEHIASNQCANPAVRGILITLRDVTEQFATEEELRTARQLVEGILNAIPVRVFWKDRELVYLGCNGAFARDAGFAESGDLVGKDDYQMGWRDQAELYRSADRAVIESGQEKLLIEEPQTTPDGRTIWLLTSKVPLRDSTGKVSGMIGTYMDVTDLKTTTWSLGERVKEQHCLYQVTALANETGLTEEALLNAVPELLGAAVQFPEITAARIVHRGRVYATPDFRASRWPLAADLVVNGEPEGRIEVCYLEERPPQAEGPFLAEERALLESVAQTLGGALASKRAMRTLVSDEQRLSSITNWSQEGIVMMDGKGRISFFNPAAQAIFGYSEAEAIGQDLHELLAPARYHATFREAFQTFKEKGQGEVIGTTRELAALRKDGSEFEMEISVAAVWLEAEWQAVGILRNITERVRTRRALETALEEQRASSRLKDELVAVASHELRTPMSAIKGLTAMVLDEDFGPVNESLMEPLQDILSSTDRLIELVNNMLEVHRLESNQLDFDIREVDANEMVGSLVRKFQPLARAKNMDLTASVEGEDDSWLVQADPIKLEQVVGNLVGNALKFTDQGGVSVATSRAGADVVIRVRDTGIGIKPEDQPQLFEKFHQISTQKSGKPAGTGLGLYISRAIIEKLGGTLELEHSVPGKGSVFKIVLPPSPR